MSMSSKYAAIFGSSAGILALLVELYDFNKDIAEPFLFAVVIYSIIVLIFQNRLLKKKKEVVKETVELADDIASNKSVSKISTKIDKVTSILPAGQEEAKARLEKLKQRYSDD